MTLVTASYTAPPVTPVTFSAGTGGKVAAKYVDVQVNGLTAGTAVIKITYSDAQLAANLIDENTVELYVWYGGAWHLGASPGRNITTNEVWGTFNVTDLTGAPVAVGGGIGGPAAIPTLNEWGIIVLMMLLAGIGAYTLRRRHADAPMPV